MSDFWGAAEFTRPKNRAIVGECRGGRDGVRSQWVLVIAAVLSLALGAVAVLPLDAAAQEDTSIGTPGHFVQYGRDYANAGNWAMAETYANLALKLKGDHPGALKLLAEAQAAKAPRAPQVADTRVLPASPSQAAAAGEDISIGTPGYFVKSGREYAAAGDWTLAESYARMGLNLDANHAGAQRLLAEAQKGKAVAAQAAAKPAPSVAARPGPKTQAAPQSCDEIYGACYASARRYSSTGPATVDYLGQQQCMVRRNICYGQRR